MTMRLSSLNPVALLFGPIFQKDVRTAGRKRGTYIMRSLYGAALLSLVGIAFAGMQSEMAMITGVRRLQQLQKLAPAMAIMIVWFQFIALCLAAPIFTGPAICDEKRARTLPALMTTPLSAAQIILGTLASRVVQLVILVLLATPLLLALRVFGGLDARVVFAATCMGISAALLGAALGLMFSVWHKRGTAAAIFGLLTLVLFMAAPSAVEGIVYYIMNDTETMSGVKQEAYSYHQQVLATCTPAEMAFLTESAMMGGELRTMEVPWVALPHDGIGFTLVKLAVPMWTLNVGYNLLLTALVTAYSTRALRRVMLKEAAEGVAAAQAPGRKRRKAKAAAPAAVGDAPPAPEPEPSEEVGREAARSREVSDHPVLWREVRQATFGSRRWFRVILVLTCVGMVGMYWSAGTTNGHFSVRAVLDNEGLHAALMILGGIGVMIQPVFMTTGSIAGEREARTWETLLTAPLTGAQIMLGKLAGALRTQWFLPAVVLGHFVAAACGGHINPLTPVHLLLIYLGPVLLFTATGQLLSLMFRRAVVAAACNLLLALGLWLGTWIGLALTAWFVDTGQGKLFDFFGAAFFSINPVAMANSISETATGRGHGRWVHDDYHLYGVHDHTLHVGMFSLVVVGVFVFYCVGAAAAMGIAIRGFRRLSGRSS